MNQEAFMKSRAENEQGNSVIPNEKPENLPISQFKGMLGNTLRCYTAGGKFGISREILRVKDYSKTDMVCCSHAGG